ncbi:MAG: queuosine precursor transporter [Parasphingorhabdus sp.]|nr:queuosine precursor transporter [Parasphingorhabdus sp.]
MTSETFANPSEISIPRGFFAVAVLYGGLACIAGVLGNKLVALGPLAVEAGIFAFLLLVVLSSAVAEVFGRATANRLVGYGMVPIVATMLLIQLVLALPPASFWEDEKRIAFDIVLNQSARLMVAGIIAYAISQFLNVFIFTRLKRADSGLLWLRSAIAGVASQAVDTLVFITIAFYGVVPIMAILPGQLLAKVVLSALLVPPLIYGAVRAIRRLGA